MLNFGAVIDMPRHRSPPNPHNFPPPTDGPLADLKQGNETFERLLALMRDGTVPFDSNATDVRKKYGDFFRYKPDRFRGAFNRAKGIIIRGKLFFFSLCGAPTLKIITNK